MYIQQYLMITLHGNSKMQLYTCKLLVFSDTHRMESLEFVCLMTLLCLCLQGEETGRELSSNCITLRSLIKIDEIEQKYVNRTSRLGTDKEATTFC